MILYDKECHLLGISKSILDFLGYEDIEEFKTYTNDVADLFQNRPGYIHRFKNFSWINYILHSGAPNKNAILSLKSGKEIEVRIAIEEIISLEGGHEGSYYRVDLQPTHVSLDSAPTKFKKSIPPSVLEEDLSFLPSQKESSFGHQDESSLNSYSYSSLPESSKEEPSDGRSNEHLAKDLNTDFEDSNIPPNDEIKISFTTDRSNDSYVLEDEKPYDCPLVQEVTKNEPQDLETLELEPYDSKLALAALEIEPSELQSFLQEYCDHVEMVSVALEDAINQNDGAVKKSLLEQLRGTSKYLQINKITQLIDTLYETDDINALNDLQAYANFLKSTHI
ncbi:MAG: hypothetical protein GX780_03880 [Campylobacteraceae bacterium]|nr:hypothetical protein [Campylobacteraceae bacterium]